MCIFSAPVKSVENTRIFGKTENGVQTLIYQMAYDADFTLAMVLPLPVEPDGKVEFVDFEHQDYRGFFDELWRLFNSGTSRSMNKSADPEPKKLKVHQVGNFEASFMPSIGDLAKLDSRFVISEGVWTALRQKHRSFGFVVVRLKPGAMSIHPLAIKFDSAFPDSVYFPTTHVHDGAVHPKAHFDHTLYLQTNASDKDASRKRFTATRKMFLTPFLAGHVVKNALVMPTRPVKMRDMVGNFANEDTWAPA